MRKKQTLPSREIAYAYTVAMYFAQQFEENLRNILYTKHYLDDGEALQLTPEEIWRLKRKEGFIDQATCLAILKKLGNSGLIKGKSPSDALRVLNGACVNRNELAHWFLVQQNFSNLTEKKEKAILRELYEMSLNLYRASQISCALSNGAVYDFDKHDRTDQQTLIQMLKADLPQELLREFRVDTAGHKGSRGNSGAKTKSRS